MENYQEKAEENLVELQRKTSKAQKNFRLIITIFVPVLMVLYVVERGIGSAHILNFVDSTSIRFIMIPCLFVLLCTGYWRGFLKAFVYVFKRDGCTAEMIEESMRAVRLFGVSSMIWGCIGFLIGMVNTLRYSIVEGGVMLAADISVTLICPFYALIINAVLVPLYFELSHLHRKKTE